MKHLIHLTDKDIFPAEMVTGDMSRLDIHRQAVKVMLFDDDGKIALVGTLGRLMPGGGVEEGESLEDAVKRECMEEVGCRIVLGDTIGYATDFRERRGTQTTHFFVARLVGDKGVPTTTQEDEQGMGVDWYTPDEAMARIIKQIDDLPPVAYNSHFNSRAQLAALKEFLAKKTSE